ncbi:MAG: ROK family protein [Brevinema sp.]
MNFLAMDVGGTTVKYALVDINGKISQEGTLPTPSKDADELLQKLITVAKDYKAKFNIAGVGLCCPGVVHPFEGRILGASFNMPKNWHCAEPKKVMEAALNMPVVIENDVNSVALAELWQGSGKELHTFICIAMGTGIGSGIIINKKLYYGAGYMAGEIGFFHANIGATMFWERKASTISLVNRVKDSLSMMRRSEEEIAAVDGISIFEKSKTDPIIAAVLDDWAEELSKGICDAGVLLNPQAVILGGGVSEQGQHLLDLVIPKVKARMAAGFNVDVLVTQTGNNAGKLGVIKRLIDENNILPA